MILTDFSLHLKQFICSTKNFEQTCYYQFKLNNNWENVITINLDNFIGTISLDILFADDLKRYAKWIHELYKYHYHDDDWFILVYSSSLFSSSISRNNKPILATIYPNKEFTVKDEIYEIEIKENNEIFLIKRYS